MTTQAQTQEYNFSRALSPLWDNRLSSDRAMDLFLSELSTAAMHAVKLYIKSNKLNIDQFRRQEAIAEVTAGMITRFRRQPDYKVRGWYTVFRNEVLNAFYKRPYSRPQKNSVQINDNIRLNGVHINSFDSRAILLTSTRIDGESVVSMVKAASMLESSSYEKCIKALSRFVQKEHVYKYSAELYSVYKKNVAMRIENKKLYSEYNEDGMMEKNKKRKPADTERVGLLLHSKGLDRLRAICRSEGLFISHVVDELIDDFCNNVDAVQDGKKRA